MTVSLKIVRDYVCPWNDMILSSSEYPFLQSGWCEALLWIVLEAEVGEEVWRTEWWLGQKRSTSSVFSNISVPAYTEKMMSALSKRWSAEALPFPPHSGLWGSGAHGHPIPEHSLPTSDIVDANALWKMEVMVSFENLMGENSNVHTQNFVSILQWWMWVLNSISGLQDDKTPTLDQNINQRKGSGEKWRPSHLIKSNHMKGLSQTVSIKIWAWKQFKYWGSSWKYPSQAIRSKHWSKPPWLSRLPRTMLFTFYQVLMLTWSGWLFGKQSESAHSKYIPKRTSSHS